MAKRKIDPDSYIGRTYDRWTIVSFSGYIDGRPKFTCLCECGVERLVPLDRLKAGESRSCGCLRISLLVANRKAAIGTPGGATHGHTRSGRPSPTYISWTMMLQRCYNPHTAGYHRYGGRGIAVCDSWRHSFESFLSDMGERPEGTSIDRINSDGNYEPSNCRWADRKTQQRHMKAIASGQKNSERRRTN